ncbi:MAG TPA: phage holin family protein [Patescibacteria group bacterium]|nr:phage holin family protein [Patescibacteria group bacterium]
MKLLMKIIINVFTLLIVSYLIPGFLFDTIWAAIVTAIVIGVVNTFIRPIIQILLLPLSIVTLGITAFLINVALLWVVAYIVPGFTINNFLTAVISSIVLTLVSTFLSKLSKG